MRYGLTMTTTQQEHRPQAPKSDRGRELAELRRSNAAGFHEDRRTKRQRGRSTERRQAIREQMEIWA